MFLLAGAGPERLTGQLKEVGTTVLKIDAIEETERADVVTGDTEVLSTDCGGLPGTEKSSLCP